jgi:Zn-dependent protease
MMLIPFLGGVAIANHPHKSLFDDAFCALMGPGFSVLPCLALLATGYLLGVPDIAQGWMDNEAALSVQDAIGLIAILIAALAGGLNLLQLLPVLPLDGGQVLRAAVQSCSVDWTRHILLGVTGLGMAGFSYTGDYVLVAFLALGALQAWHLGNKPPKARPMSAPGLTVIGLGYALTLAVHAGAVLYGLHITGFWLS